jgi:hypothetical protein
VSSRVFAFGHESVRGSSRNPESRARYNELPMAGTSASARCVVVEPEFTSVLFVAQESWRAAVRLAVLLVVGMPCYVAIEPSPSWLPLWHSTHARWLKGRATIAFLDGLAIVYGPVFVVALVTACVLTFRRSRRPLSPARARVLLLSTAMVLSLLALEAGAAFWQAWLHRGPMLPSDRSAESTSGANADCSRDRMTATALDRSGRLSYTKSGINTGALPLRILDVHFATRSSVLIDLDYSGGL